MKTRQEKRKTRVRAKICGSSDRPRLSVYRSNNHMYVQLIDDIKQKTLIGLSDKQVVGLKEKQTKMEIAQALGKKLAEEAVKKSIKKAIFDRGSYAYHGVVAKIARGAREGGLEF